MSKKDLEDRSNEAHDHPNKPKRAAAPKVSLTKRSLTRRVKFADPLSVQRSYDKTASPAGVETETKLHEAKSHSKSELSDLQPPLSLVAQLDIAAHKLHARPNSNLNLNEDQSLKSLKSMRSMRSSKATKSVASIKEHSPSVSPTSPRDK